MAIQAGPFCFYAPPRTGSKWVLSVLARVYGDVGTTGIHQVPGTEEPGIKLTIVRDVEDWIRSFRRTMTNRWIRVPCVDRLQDEISPALVEQMFREYAGDITLHTETLATDTETLLRDHGVEAPWIAEMPWSDTLAVLSSSPLPSR